MEAGDEGTLGNELENCDDNVTQTRQVGRVILQLYPWYCRNHSFQPNMNPMFKCVCPTPHRPKLIMQIYLSWQPAAIYVFFECNHHKLLIEGSSINGSVWQRGIQEKVR